MSCPLAGEEQDLPISCQLTGGGLSMPEIRGRKDGNPTRSRPRPTKPNAPTEFGDNILDDETTAAGQSTQEPSHENEEHIGFDEETNNRYEEIKRGETHISELQQ